MSASHQDKLARIHKAVSTGDMLMLLDDEVALHEQLEFVFELMLSGEFTHGEILSRVRDRFRMGSVTASGRIRDAKVVFGDVTKGQRAMDQHILYMRAEAIYKKALNGTSTLRPEDLQGLDEDEQLELIAAAGGKGPDLIAALQALSLMVKIKGVDKDEPLMIDPSKLGGDTVVRLGKLNNIFWKKFLEQGGGDLSALMGEAVDAVIEEQPETVKLGTGSPDPHA